MEQIVLYTNLRFLLKTLDLKEKGELFTALLEQNGENLVGDVADIYQYIFSLQMELGDKKRKMKALSQLAVAARQKAAEASLEKRLSTVTDGQPTVLKRKVTKENILNNKIKKIFISTDETKVRQKKEVLSERAFVPPKVEEVVDFVQKNGLFVNAEMFVDFYESHGWCVGKTPIKNWQATVRLWHRRAAAKEDGAQYVYCGVDDGAKKSAPAALTEARESVLSPSFLAVTGEAMHTETVHQPETPNFEAVKNDEKLKGESASYRERLLKNGTACDRKNAAMRESSGGDKCQFEGENNATVESPFARFMRRIEDNDILPEAK